MAKVFISYSHRQFHWVWTRLKPVLEAGGAEVLIDAERFEPGKGVVGQMDDVQQQAEKHLLVLSREYVESRYCMHELRAAIHGDPKFESGRVIPIRLDDCDLPSLIADPEPLIVELTDESPAEWDRLVTGCGLDLGSSPLAWLEARDAIVRHLTRRDNVSFVTGRGVAWKPLLKHLRECLPPPQAAAAGPEADRYGRHRKLHARGVAAYAARGAWCRRTTPR